MDLEFSTARMITAHTASASWKTIPRVAFNYEADFTTADPVFKTLRKNIIEQSGVKVSLTKSKETGNRP